MPKPRDLPSMAHFDGRSPDTIDAAAEAHAMCASIVAHVTVDTRTFLGCAYEATLTRELSLDRCSAVLLLHQWA